MLHYLKATFADGRTECTGSTRAFKTCWIDDHGRRHWTMKPMPAGATAAPAETITAKEYRAMKDAART